MDSSTFAFSAIVFAPAALAAICFLVSIWFALRMFAHFRSERRWMVFFLGPAILASDSVFTPEGAYYFKSFKLWFRRCAYLLLGWGILVLLLHFATRAFP